MESRVKVDFDGIERGDFGALQELLHGLRGENGCPWDRAQTYESLKPCIIDEMTEVLAAIHLYEASGDAENLCEELGDILMHVIFLTDMAAEKGLFSMEDVVRGVGKKMLRRHPHVFGEDARRGWEHHELAADAPMPEGWNEIKNLEKQRITPEQKTAKENAYREAAQEAVERLRQICTSAKRQGKP